MKLHSNTLLVEGKDDFNVIRNLWVARFPSDRRGEIVLCPDRLVEFEIVEAGEGDTGGDTKLLGFLSLYLKQRPPTLERLGAVLDANDSLVRRWAQITQCLRTTGYDPPDDLPSDGLMLEHPEQHRPFVGIWLMPDNQLPGKLEDFVRLLVPRDDALAPKADSVLDEIEKEGLQKYEPKDRSKAFIYTWLAWQKEPGRPMGRAITQKALNPDSSTADPFIAWLQRLFCTIP